MVFRVSYSRDGVRESFLFDTKDYQRLVDPGFDVDDVVSEVKNLADRLDNVVVEYLEPQQCTLDSMIESLKKHYGEI